MTLMRDLIDIPTSVSEGDFVVRASEVADLGNYVVTDQLRDNFRDALTTVGHAVTTGRSQAKFLHGSFGSGKSHFMAVLREVLRHNPGARAIRGLAEPIAEADVWLRDRDVLCLTFHMLDATSVEQAVLEGYLNQITALHPQAPPPAVHRSDALLADAEKIRASMGDDAFFATLGGGTGLAAALARREGWTAESYALATAQPPGVASRDSLVGALTAAFFSGAVRSGEYLDLDTGLRVMTRHATSLGYHAVVLFLDELVLWLSTRIADHTFVNTEGAKLNKLIESSDAARPLPLISFVARQRNIEEFLGPQVGGTEREALAHVMRSVQGRLGEIVLADTNLPEIAEKRLLRPTDDAARRVIDDAFAAVRGRRDVWDTLLLGAQYGDAGIGSDAAAFRKLYPFSPALVATLVALSQALQRERTALRVMTELLVARRDTLRVNDLIGVAALFDPLVMRGELPDRPLLRQQFQAARDTYRTKLRPLLRSRYGIGEDETSGHEQFELDDRLIKTLLLGALVPEVPALSNLTAARLHALNFGSIASPLPGYENQIVVERLGKLVADAGALHMTEGPDPVFSLKLSAVDYDRLLELVPDPETSTGVQQQLIRDLIGGELKLGGADEVLGEFAAVREWRGRRHQVNIRFGNIRDRDAMPDSSIYATGDAWRIVIDYPFDMAGHSRRDDKARIEQLDRGSRTVFWLPYFLTDDHISRVIQLAKINYLLGSGGTGDRLTTLAADWSLADRQQGKVYLRQRQQLVRSSLLESLRQAYGVVKAQTPDVEDDSIPVLHTLAEGLPLGDPRGGSLPAAFDNLTADLLRWSYPGTPALPEDEKPVSKAETAKIWGYAKAAAADPTRGTTVEPADRRIVARVCNPLKLGESQDNRYALTSTLCWWSGHLLQGAAKDGYTEQFPVHVLRGLLDVPSPRGFDRDLANLILAVFALEHQLAWYERGGKVELGSLNMINDQMELRRPPMAVSDVWERAVRRAKAIFGKPVPEHSSPTAQAEFASIVRREARAYAGPAHELAERITRHAGSLGLDVDARSGRLATIRRVSRLLRDLAAETDDVVVVGLIADADAGDIDDVAAGTAFKQAAVITEALTRTNWPLLDAVTMRADTEESARAIIESLHTAARADEHVERLGGALTRAVDEATRLLARPRPEPRVTGPRVTDPRAADTGGSTGAVGQPTDSTIGTRDATRTRDVTTASALDDVRAAIAKDLDGDHTVRVTWEVLR